MIFLVVAKSNRFLNIHETLYSTSVLNTKSPSWQDHLLGGVYLVRRGERVLVGRLRGVLGRSFRFYALHLSRLFDGLVNGFHLLIDLCQKCIDVS